MDRSPPGSSIYGILQAIILEWMPFPSPGYLLNPGIEPRPRALWVDSLPSEPLGKDRELVYSIWTLILSVSKYLRGNLYSMLGIMVLMYIIATSNLSSFVRPEVQNQGVGWVGFFFRVQRENLFHVSF